MNIRKSWRALSLIIGLLLLGIPFTIKAQSTFQSSSIVLVLTPTPTPLPTSLPGPDLSYQASFQVQNLGNSTANIQINYYSQYQGYYLGSLTDTISTTSSKTYWPFTLPNYANAFNGSIIITSDQPIATITNLVTSDLFSGEAVESLSAGSTTVSLPLIMCENSGYNTFFNVQNVGNADANVTIQYIPGSNGVPGSENATISVGAEKTFDQTQGSFIGTVDCFSLKDSSGKFIGSVKITSNQPVTASVIELNTTNHRSLLYYNGFGSGSTTVALPLIMANNSGYYTGVQVQNGGSSTTTVTLTYAPNTVPGGNNPVPEVFTLGPGVSKTIQQIGTPPGNGSANNWDNMGRYIGSATITNSGSQPLMAMVNQAYSGTDKGPYGSAYDGFNPAAVTRKASAPLIMSNNSGYYTGIQTQNVGSISCNVTITYGTNTAGSFAPQPEVFSLNPGTSKTIIQNGSPPSNGSTVNDWDSYRYVGSAVINGDNINCKLAAIVNEIAPTKPGDTLYTYDAFNY